MKKIITICAVLLITASVFAQTPEKMSYQAVVRNGSNALVTSTTVGMQISILQGSVSGTSIYVETQTPSTNANGLVSLEIGAGTVVSGNFTTIDWANGPYFIKTETDPTGGTNYTITGTSQLLSVPYALHAKTAETVTGTITETDPIFGASVASGITGTDTTNWNNHFSGNYNDLSNSPTNVSTFTNDAGYLTSYTETDQIFGASVASGITGTDTTNWNNKLDSYTETDPIFTAWDKDYNDLINTPTIPTNVSAFTNDAGYINTQIDSSGIAAYGYVAEKTYTVGLWPELGGYVFWVSPDGKHGIVAETIDQSSTSKQYYDAQDLISNPANHSANGQYFRDWRLPTLFELQEMYAKRTDIGGFVTEYYWSTKGVDYTDDQYEYVWIKTFFSGSESNGGNKSNYAYIRSVRTF
jgi:hypothetical protein